MSKPFPGIFAYGRFPVFLVSLSGGGFRAALYHAGVMRSLHEAGIVVFDCRSHKVFVNAVSGGAIPALIWDCYLRSNVADSLWPEKTLLDLVTSVPRFGGRYNWKIRTTRSWFNYLAKWWQRNAPAKVKEESDTITLVQVLDYLTGGIFVLCGTSMCEPDREFFKTGDSRNRTISNNDTRISIVPFHIAQATAFPGYFPRWQVAIGSSGKKYELLDAGLVDNLAAYAFLPFFVPEGPAGPIQDGSVWFRSNAGAELLVPRNAVSLPWATKVARLSVLDRLFRYTGDLAQPIYENLITSLVWHHTNLQVTGARIGVLPHKEVSWHVTPRFPDPESAARMPTALARTARDDAIAVMLQGAQTASVALQLPIPAREKIKASLMSLR
ncbi:MAG: patatin-like phospholipase family protein [Hyphomicrobiaceae bacterium]